MYRKELSQVDEIYTNSTNLQTAIRHYLGRESQILHPPVDMNIFVPSPHSNPLPEGEGVEGNIKVPLSPLEEELGVRALGIKDYYISFSKLSTLKRVAQTVEVFKDISDKKLLIIYGENDPQKDEIMNIATGCENITFLTLADNNELPKYVAGAIATIFIAKNEDFGMVALESMSCGVPVIGVDE
jgi:glycosyltransferase involved in cell wall biosynthesis